ncbi:FAD-dependent oxidoreductase [Duganella sp. LX20W]|uniref:FAD-dependent oxidoreductase n=1 Tax=Rugamonas brunnea TaxID=2758569 RepID=A0A7W2ID24_9BURK|nr:FAD/NAD(P)-binding oxidoreductase [Rugamonas brunnea]MBA5638954.1 FAD-dependent oxidoreductase [Rugamonas brunnea]
MKRAFDVLVIGAGPAGLAAAHAAAAHGISVGVVDDNPQAGGQIWRGGPAQQADARARDLWHTLANAPNVTLLHQCRVVCPLDGKLLLAQTPAGAIELRYEKLVIATGARELLLPFPGWTLPGVTGAGGLQALAKGGYPVAGKRVIVAGSGPLLLASAATLQQQGAQIAAIIEQAAWPRLARFALGLLATPSKVTQALQLACRLRDVPYLRDSYVLSAHGGDTLQSVRLQRGGRTEQWDCDLLACGYGLLPNVELALALGCAVDGQGMEPPTVQVDPWQRTSVPDVLCAGEGTGVGGVDLALAEGRIAGLAAAGHTREAPALFAERARWRKFAARLARAFAPRPELARLADDDTVVCRCEDVRHGELRPHTSWRSAKLHTRCGMGPCQGRVCGGATGLLYGWRPDAVRVPLSPARISSFIEE